MLNSIYFRLSHTYFSYFAILGVVAHYFGLYLSELGLSPLQVGTILSVMTIGRIFGPFLWANLADKKQNKRQIIRIGASLALLFFIPLLFSHQFYLMLCSLTIFTLFWTAILPQLESVCAACYKGNAKLYSRTRVWGSISFTGLVMASGIAFEWLGVINTIEWATLSLLGLLVLSSWRLPQDRRVVQAKQDVGSIKQTLLKPQVIMFYVACFLLQLSFAAYYGFFSIYLTELGYSGTQIGILIAFGVLCEVLLFVKAGHIVQLWSLKWIFIGCYLASAVRWLTIGQWPEQFWLLLAAQSIHALGYGLHHIAAQRFIRSQFPAKQQSRGQAIYVGATYGLGGAIGSISVGAMWDWNASATYVISGLVALLACLLTLKLQVK
ncbi:hypothetical protein C2869_17890 [Saccharobesus litoralis]|uniref:Major facilitator superfamily (MFS) profile domain-containing protein n=1 Tax=Saccharobesus litoralis TaxID=2172099 RepID=A0A2S0VVN6_9ALTE|nr:MFS transporter [Saccharobesus litoralis]AWB68170.1 hypothetical protein C2869_17890 [Saccharobesus litoralis]